MDSNNQSQDLSGESARSPRPAQADRLEAIRDGLVALSERIAAKRASIRSWDNYGEATFLAFDSYNLGLTEAHDMLGAFIATMEIDG